MKAREILDAMGAETQMQFHNGVMWENCDVQSVSQTEAIIIPTNIPGFPRVKACPVNSIRIKPEEPSATTSLTVEIQHKHDCDPQELLHWFWRLLESQDKHPDYKIRFKQ